MNRSNIENFNWSFRLGRLAHSDKVFDRIDIDPGPGCMESRDLEHWYYLGMGLYLCKRKNMTIWLDKEKDFKHFRVEGITFTKNTKTVSN